jgi:uncharacterized RDD family membrane protein YckC
MTVAVRVTPEAAVPTTDNAGLATRLLAFAADALIIDVAAWLVGGVVAVAASAFGFSDSAQTVLLAGGAVLGALWAAGCFIFFWSTTGQTPGNRVMRIRVRDEREDRPLTLGRAVVRLLGAILSALLLFLGYVMILFDPRRRGLHDHMARSIVVYVPRVRRPPPWLDPTSP